MTGSIGLVNTLEGMTPGERAFAVARAGLLAGWWGEDSFATFSKAFEQATTEDLLTLLEARPACCDDLVDKLA